MAWDKGLLCVVVALSGCGCVRIPIGMVVSTIGVTWKDRPVDRTGGVGVGGIHA